MGLGPDDFQFENKKNVDHYDWLDEVTFLNGKAIRHDGIYDDYGHIVFLKPGGDVTDESTHAAMYNFLGDEITAEQRTAPHAIHHACWQCCGRPTLSDVIKAAPKANPDLVQYQGQDLDVEALVEDGKEWMIVNPTSSSKDGRANKKRILDFFQGLSSQKKSSSRSVKQTRQSNSTKDRTAKPKKTRAAASSLITKKQILTKLSRLNKEQLSALYKQLE